MAWAFGDGGKTIFVSNVWLRIHTCSLERLRENNTGNMSTLGFEAEEQRLLRLIEYYKIENELKNLRLNLKLD